jgi:hypothetical protein
MQICVQDAFATRFSSFTCYDTVSYCHTTLTFLFIKYYVILVFCQYGMHDITYDTPIVTSLRLLIVYSII